MDEKRVTVRMSRELHEALRQVAREQGRSLNAQIVYWLRERLGQVEDEGGGER